MPNFPKAEMFSTPNKYKYKMFIALCKTFTISDYNKHTNVNYMYTCYNAPSNMLKYTYTY